MGGIQLKLTFPCYLTLEAENEKEGWCRIKSGLEYLKVKDGVSYVVGRAVPGEFNRSKETPVGRPKSYL